VHRWKLTGQEAKVFANLVTGDSNRQIAAKIGCAERTVELHVTHILQRLDVESRNAAIAKFWTQL
jgi:DNA-binding NarL/FixJ family response regulator